MSEWDYTNERVIFWMDLNGDFEWVCSTITSQNIYGRAPTIILLTMKPSSLFVKIRCHAVPSTWKRSAVRNSYDIPVQENIGDHNTQKGHGHDFVVGVVMFKSWFRVLVPLKTLYKES
ncbi:core histone macro-H2A.1 [Trichonephila clavipes]|nr:core histone macro-H2A.1 [Trichonephila clavipes]